MKPGEHYTYNSIDGHIRFNNGSSIILVELAFKPSDPSYTRLGGLLLTFGCIDEAGETDKKAKEIFQSRIGRWCNVKYDLKPFLLMTCNPSRNFLFEEFYLANKENRIPDYRKFINATAYDNPHLPKTYIDNLLKTLTSNEVNRLLLGNWEFETDPNLLISYEDIIEAYDLSNYNNNDDKTRYISTDIAFKGDACVLVVWEGLTIIDIIKVKDSEIVLDVIKSTATKYEVQTRNISYDSDGVGLYLKDYLRTARPITNNGRPFNNENYVNVKTQFYYRLGELFRNGKIKIKVSSYKSDIEKELLSIKRKDRDTTIGKMEINSKAEQKQILGHSPDFADAIAYRMIFEFKRNSNIIIG